MFWRFSRARSPQTSGVAVGRKTVKIPTPFPSPEDGPRDRKHFVRESSTHQPRITTGSRARHTSWPRLPVFQDRAHTAGLRIGQDSCENRTHARQAIRPEAPLERYAAAGGGGSASGVRGVAVDADGEGSAAAAHD